MTCFKEKTPNCAISFILGLDTCVILDFALIFSIFVTGQLTYAALTIPDITDANVNTPPTPISLHHVNLITGRERLIERSWLCHFLRIAQSYMLKWWTQHLYRKHKSTGTKNVLNQITAGLRDYDARVQSFNNLGFVHIQTWCWWCAITTSEVIIIGY